MNRIHLIIAGDVQGVGFRSWVLHEVKNKDIAGWVANRPDGAVELVAEGEKKELEILRDNCHKGPEVAWVSSVKEDWSEATGEFVGFEVRE